MKYALTFNLIAIGFCVLAILHRSFYWLLLWPALSFMIVGLAYALAHPRLLGKRQDGTINTPMLVLLFPYYLYTWAIWHLVVLISREPAHAQILPGLYLGRRPRRADLPDSVDLIVDLTAEFHEPQKTINGRTYLCYPTLDADIMAPAQMHEAVENLLAHRGHALVHCAQGHGRSAALVAALLLRKGVSSNAEDAEAFVRRARPGAKLNSKQRQQLKVFEKTIHQSKI